MKISELSALAMLNLAVKQDVDIKAFGNYETDAPESISYVSAVKWVEAALKNTNLVCILVPIGTSIDDERLICVRITV